MFLLLYLVFGLGFYCGAVALNFNSLKHANKMSIMRGLIGGILFWPVLMPFIISIRSEKNE